MIIFFAQVQKILEILEDEIHSGKYNPGDRLIKREIADRLGVSRVPVREALIISGKVGIYQRKKAKVAGNRHSHQTGYTRSSPRQTFYRVPGI